MFNIKGDLKGIKKHLNRTQKKLLPKATVNAINKTLFQIMKAEKAQMVKKLDRPKPWTLKGFKINMAKPNKWIIKGDISIQTNRWWYLKWVVDGGTKRGELGVPIKGNAVLNAFGNIPGKGYGKKRYAKGKNQFRATINGVDGVWLKTGGKRNPKLKLMVAL